MREMINIDHVYMVRQGVEAVMADDDSGHGMDHVNRVEQMSRQFAAGDERVRQHMTRVIGLLHDVDDYKLVGSRELAAEQRNATAIMQQARITRPEQEEIRASIASIGYSKALRGVRPATPEGMIVSDADMCDAIGASGVVRCLTYALSSKGSGVVFDRSVWPIEDITAETYNGHGTTHDTDSFVNHFFEKLLKLPGMMMTEAGRVEAERRDKVTVEFLRAFFRENDAADWSNYFESYVASR